MTREYPLVSVIVRTKDRPILLKKALKSIASQIYRNLEVVLINDGGCDLELEELQGILGDIALLYRKLDKNTGRAHAGNAGIEIAQGGYIGFLDDDDEFYPDHILTLVNILETYDYKAAYTDTDIAFFDFDPEKTEIVQKEKRLFTSGDFSFKELLIDNYIPLISLLFRSNVLRDHGGFDENFDMYEDWDLLIRIAEKFPFYHAGKVTAEYIQWSNNLQISQSPLFFDKASAYHNQIIIKHKKKYTSEIIRSLVQSRRMLRDKDARITLLEDTLRETEDQFRQALRGRDEQISGLEKSLELKDNELAQGLKVLRGRDERIADLEKSLGLKEHEVAELGQALQGRDERIADLDSALQGKDASVNELTEKSRNLEQRIREKESHIDHLNKLTGDHEKQIAELQNVVNNRDMEMFGLMREKDRHITELKAELKEKADHIGSLEGMKHQLENAFREKEASLNRILNSDGWKGLLFYYNIRDRILPPNTGSRALVKACVRKMAGLVKVLRKRGRTDIGSCPEGTVSSFSEDTGEKESCRTGNDSMKENQESRISGWSEQKFSTSGDSPMNRTQKSVLVAGIYLANQENGIEEIVAQLSQSKNYHVVQKWIALYGNAPSPAVDSVTIMRLENPQPKFILLNKMLSAEKLSRYDYIMICDDDIFFCQNFLDNFLELQEKYDFALAQPARTHNSYIDHPFVEQFEGLKARRTRFIEIGPVVSMRNDTFPILLPFDESSYMGWGYDFVWPCLIEERGLRMGIIDAAPVAHSMRKPVKNYDYKNADTSMKEYLSKNPHLTKEEAFRILESYT